jgi:hypothetical protein
MQCRYNVFTHGAFHLSNSFKKRLNKGKTNLTHKHLVVTKLLTHFMGHKSSNIGQSRVVLPETGVV